MNEDEIIIPRWVFELLHNTCKDRVIRKEVDDYSVTLLCPDKSLVPYIAEFTDKANYQREEIELEGLWLYLTHKNMEHRNVK